MMLQHAFNIGSMLFKTILFFVYVYWEYICTCIQALHQYIKSHSATKDYNYMYLVRITFNDVSCLQ